METVTETSSAIGGKVAEARETVENIARSAGQKIGAGRDETADTLRGAASSVREAGQQGSETIDKIANGTADKLDSTASYLENWDLSRSGLRQFGSRHLTGLLLGALAVGFCVGSARRRSSSFRRKPNAA